MTFVAREIEEAGYTARARVRACVRMFCFINKWKLWSVSRPSSPFVIRASTALCAQPHLDVRQKWRDGVWEGSREPSDRASERPAPLPLGGSGRLGRFEKRVCAVMREREAETKSHRT